MRFYRIELYDFDEVVEGNHEPLTFVRTEKRDANRLFSKLRRAQIKKGNDAQLFMASIHINLKLTTKELVRRLLEGDAYDRSDVHHLRSWGSS